MAGTSLRAGPGARHAVLACWRANEGGAETGADERHNRQWSRGGTDRFGPNLRRHGLDRSNGRWRLDRRCRRGRYGGDRCRGRGAPGLPFQAGKFHFNRAETAPKLVNASLGANRPHDKPDRQGDGRSDEQQN